jgi:hypothetical protein
MYVVHCVKKILEKNEVIADVESKSRARKSAKEIDLQGNELNKISNLV